MHELLPSIKKCPRAMNPYVLLLYEMVRELRPENTLEIGVRQAQSTRSILAALDHHKHGLHTSVDLGDRSDRVPEFLSPFWRQVVGDSHKEETLAKVSDRTYQFLLIDGDHSYEGVKKDFEMYTPLVEPGGYVLLHDTHNINEGVPQFWEEITWPSKLELKYGIAGMGLLQKPLI